MRPNARRGFTVVEALVGSAIGAFLALAAVAVSSHQTRLLGLTNDRLELAQTGRSAIVRLTSDLRIAGAGIGYTGRGEFAGIEVGAFTRGSATFDSNNQLITLSSGNTITDDIGILVADGGYATIAAYNPAGSGQLCHGSGISAGEVIVLQSEDGLSARTVRVTALATGVCTRGQCRDGCDDFSWTADAGYVSGPEATSVNYAGGEAAGGFRRITWFVEATDPTNPGVGRLHRVEGDCTARDRNCGEVVADYVESLQVRLYQRGNDGWVDQTGRGARMDGEDRIRVDVELVSRARTRITERSQLPAVLALEDTLCIPACGTRDDIARRVVRTSIEIRNAGRMRYRRDDQ